MRVAGPACRGVRPAGYDGHPRQRKAGPLSTAGQQLSTAEYLQKIGVGHIEPRVCPFDPGYDPATLESHLEQSAHLMSALIGLDRIECGEGFTEHRLDPSAVVAMARERGLEVEFEMGKKHGGPFTADSLAESIEQGRQWLDAGAVMLVVEARESARGVGLFDEAGVFEPAFADEFAAAFGLLLFNDTATTE